MANTPEVDDWLHKTLMLTAEAIRLSGPGATHDEMQMLRQVQTACETLLRGLQRLASVPPNIPPPDPNPNPGPTGPMGAA